MIEAEIIGRVPSVLTRRQVSRAVEYAVKALPKKPEGAFAVAFVTEAAMRKLNRKHRGMDKPTDVLSFAAADFEAVDAGRSLRAGDLFVAPAFVRRDAAKAGEAYRIQLMRVIVHGVLHLMGLDHAEPAQAKRMFALQERVLEKLL